MEGNEIVGILLLGYQKEPNEIKRQLILRALESILDHFPDLMLNYLTSPTIKQRADDGAIYHTRFESMIVEN